MVGDAQSACGSYSSVADLFQSLGNHDEAVHFLTKCINIARERADIALEAMAAQRLSRVYNAMGERDIAVQSAEDVVRLASASGDEGLLLTARRDLLAAYATRASEMEAQVR